METETPPWRPLTGAAGRSDGGRRRGENRVETETPLWRPLAGAAGRSNVCNKQFWLLLFNRGGVGQV